MRGWLSKRFGDRGERAAARYLRRRGYRILTRQAATRIGEIDLIALDGECIVFVEVKTRRDLTAGHPAEAVTFNKQKKLTALALSYLKRHGLLERPARFDVVTVLWPQGARKPAIEHFQSAFEAVGKGQMYS